MSTDLDTCLRAALTDAATTTRIADDALTTIVQRGETTQRPHRRRALVAGVAFVGVVVGTGTAWAIVTDRLNADQAQIIEQIPTCGLDAETARVVASVEAYGRTVDYWIVDADGRSGDFLFERGETDGGGGCSEQTRQQVHPTLPWASYLLDAGAGTGLFWIYGQAPNGTTEVQIVMSTGSINAPVESDGYFVALAELPYNADDTLVRVDALSDAGQVIATGRS